MIVYMCIHSSKQMKITCIGHRYCSTDIAAAHLKSLLESPSLLLVSLPPRLSLKPPGKVGEVYGRQRLEGV